MFLLVCLTRLRRFPQFTMASLPLRGATVVVRSEPPLLGSSVDSRTFLCTLMFGVSSSGSSGDGSSSGGGITPHNGDPEVRPPPPIWHETGEEIWHDENLPTLNLAARPQTYLEWRASIVALGTQAEQEYKISDNAVVEKILTEALSSDARAKFGSKFGGEVGSGVNIVVSFLGRGNFVVFSALFWTRKLCSTKLLIRLRRGILFQ